MKIYTAGGELAFSTFRFPDGQPHFKLETYEREFNTVTIETRITSPNDLFDVALVNDVLRRAGYNTVNLDILYLMGARMDRAISWAEPFTLQLIANFINQLGFTKVRILDAHSVVATNLIRHAENILPTQIVTGIVETLGQPIIVCPDAGARERVKKMCYKWNIANATKKRDPNTGQLSGFELIDPSFVRGKNCLIVDDICDGGGTFIGLIEVLKRSGAEKIYLFTTHGIYSKGTVGLVQAGFEKLYTTNSFRDSQDGLTKVVIIPVNMRNFGG